MKMAYVIFPVYIICYISKYFFSQSVCPLPYWSGNKFSYVKAVTDDWALLKTRFKPDPEFESDKFWKTADFTGVVVCDRDLGMDGVTSLELKTRSGD